MHSSVVRRNWFLLAAIPVLTGAFVVTQRAIPHLRASGRGADELRPVRFTRAYVRHAASRRGLRSGPGALRATARVLPNSWPAPGPGGAGREQPVGDQLLGRATAHEAGELVEEAALAVVEHVLLRNEHRAAEAAPAQEKPAVAAEEKPPAAEEKAPAEGEKKTTRRRTSTRKADAEKAGSDASGDEAEGIWQRFRSARGTTRSSGRP